MTRHDRALPSRIRLFVYGTLMRNGSNHALLASAQFIGEARTPAAYAVVRVDGYPALVPGADEVSGELYEVDAGLLGRIDAYEGEAYRRARVVLDGGEVAETYVLATGGKPD